MFTVEMEHDKSIVIAMDESDAYEDLEVQFCDDGTVFLIQHYPDMEETSIIYVSYQQLMDVVTALDMPVGMYRIAQ